MSNLEDLNKCPMDYVTKDEFVKKTRKYMKKAGQTFYEKHFDEIRLKNKKRC